MFHYGLFFKTDLTNLFCDVKVLQPFCAFAFNSTMQLTHCYDLFVMLVSCGQTILETHLLDRNVHHLLDHVILSSLCRVT